MVLPWAATANAESILLSDLASFAVLGATTVTNTGSTTLVSGNVGVHAGTAIVPGSTGFTFAGPSAGTSIVGGVASLAQTQLDTALGLLGGLATSGSVLGGVLDGLMLGQGVYDVSAAAGNGGFNLSTGGVLTLDAAGSSNPFWVFQMSSSLNTGSGSVVQFVNQGANFNPGVYWAVASSAVIGTSTSFQGNILAVTSIALLNSATIGCGSALAANGAVTMDTNTISTGCNGSLSVVPGSEGGPIVVGPDQTPVPTPEPASLLLIGTAVAGMFGKARLKRAKQMATTQTSL